MFKDQRFLLRHLTRLSPVRVRRILHHHGSCQVFPLIRSTQRPFLSLSLVASHRLVPPLRTFRLCITRLAKGWSVLPPAIPSRPLQHQMLKAQHLFLIRFYLLRALYQLRSRILRFPIFSRKWKEIALLQLPQLVILRSRA